MMEWSQWLRGGPFLQVSFILEMKEEKAETILGIINRLSKVTTKVEIVDDDMNEIIDFFVRGYPDDEEDPQSKHIHSLRLKLYVYLSRKRKSTLQIEMVSPNALVVDFWFYGDEDDAPEWDQIGIKIDEFPEFTNFLEELFSVYEFKIGGIAIEEDVLQLLGFNETYPNDCFRYENVFPDHFMKEPPPFLNIIWNEKYKKLRHIPYNYKKLSKQGILIDIDI